MSELHTERRLGDRLDAERIARIETMVDTIGSSLAEHIREDHEDRKVVLNRLESIDLRLSKWYGGVVATGVIVSAIWAAVGMVMVILAWRFPAN